MTTSLGITPVISCIICVIVLLVNPPIGRGLPLAWVTLINSTNSQSFGSVQQHSSLSSTFTTSPTSLSSAILLYSPLIHTFITHTRICLDIPFEIFTYSINSAADPLTFILINIKYIPYYYIISC